MPTILHSTDVTRSTSELFGERVLLSPNRTNRLCFGGCQDCNAKQGEAERMEIRSTRSFSAPEVLVSGRRFGLSLLASICAAAGVGIVSYYSLIRTMGTVLGSALPQIVTFAVYLTLVAVLCYSFRPPSRPPIALHFTSIKDLVFAIGATIAPHCGLCACVCVSGSVFWRLSATARAIDRRGDRRQTSPRSGSSAWVFAILRGCLLVP